MQTLRDQLEALKRPVEVDQLNTVVATAEDAVHRAVQTHARRIRESIDELAKQREQMMSAVDEAKEQHESTGVGGGLMATLRSTVAHEQVEQNRERSFKNLMGAASVYARRIQRMLALSQETLHLQDDLDFAVEALEDLAGRARGAELVDESLRMDRAIQSLRRLRPSIRPLAAPLAEPIAEARQTLSGVKHTIVGFRTSERAATVTESLFDDVLSPNGGEWTQAARNYVADKAGAWIPDADRSGATRDEVLKELDASFDRISEADRRDEALRRAAEEELDSLE